MIVHYIGECNISPTNGFESSAKSACGEKGDYYTLDLAKVTCQDCQLAVMDMTFLGSGNEPLSDEYIDGFFPECSR
jgi:hypothetical protein